MSGTQILQPEVTITLANADGEVGNAPQQILLVGQKTSAGSAVSGTLVQNLSSSGAPENALFGEDSQLAAMVRAVKNVNQVNRVDAIPLDDAAGTARELEFTVLGTATAAGTITVTAGSDVDFVFPVAINDTDTATAIGAAITAAVNADPKVPFTASDAVGVVTLTAVNLGTVANDLGVQVELEDADGITISVPLAETVPGATDPTLTGVLDVATDRYQGIVWPYADLSVLQTFLAARQDPVNTILDGVGFHLDQGTAVALAAIAAAENDRNIVLFGDETVIGETNYVGPAQNAESYVKVSLFAGIRAIRLTDDQPISRFLTSSASLDQFGGTALASLPYFNTPMADLPTIKAGRGFTQLEVESLFTAGMSVMGVNRTGTGALVGEVVTTFKTDPAGNPDPTFQFLNYVDTTSNIREYFFNNYKSRFAQSRLTEGAVSRGRDMVNSAVFRAYTEQLYLDLAGADFVLVQDGEDALAFFKSNLTITLDLASGKITTTMLVPIVTQLRQIIATIKVAFSTQS